MKKHLFISALVLTTLGSMGQTKNHKIGIETGAYLQHYNGNLGNSFFKFNTTAFGGTKLNLGLYLNKSLDLNVGASIGHFGYCQTEEDKQRIVSIEQRCPGCTDQLGMGELRSLMISGNIAIKYKFANGVFLKENSKLSPYIYAGAGINRLSDNMGRNCVNVGIHLTINGGAGITYNITERINIGYNLGLGCFVTKKVYNTKSTERGAEEQDADDIKMEKRKDLYMQNGLTLGINF
jgi:OmpA-OmpF porin, OOP family